MYVCVYIYIYISRETERERETERDVRRIMFTIEGIVHGDPSSNPEWVYIPHIGKGGIQLFSFQLWVNNRADWAL